jgi:uncharacterized protein (DUF1330 family)
MNTAFWISTFSSIKSKNNFLEYSKLARFAIKKYGGKLIFASDKIMNLEGVKFRRIVCVKFASSSIAKKCFRSTEYRKAKKFLKSNAKRNLSLLEY